MTSRHSATVWRSEITRVLKPGGSYFAQHVGLASAFELVEYFLGGPLWEACGRRHPARETAEVTAAGLEIADVRCESLRMEFFDIAAVIYFLRKVPWLVREFSGEAYRDRLRELHERIEANGVFRARSTRTRLVARKPS